MILSALLAGSTAPGAVPQARKSGPDFEVDGNVVRHPVWGVQVEVPEYEPWDDIQDLSEKPNFVLAAESHQACGLPITMWVERVPDGTTAESSSTSRP